MKKKWLLTLVAMPLLAAACTGRGPGADGEKLIEESALLAATQAENMLQEVGAPDKRNYPRTLTAEGSLRTTSIRDWTSGFFPGSLWYLYELTGDEKWKTRAEEWTASLEELKTFTGHHDIGFMMYCSYGNAVRLAPRENYEEILVRSAESLCSRYSDKVKAIKSWNSRKSWDGNEWRYPVIVDNMMNLELLFYAYRVTGEKRFYDIAVAHANTTLKNHFRPDNGSYHVVSYDPETGEVCFRQTCQGYSDNSTWSRGQAWAVYGYTMMYRETRDTTYLGAACRFADYFINHLPQDMIPVWDFNAGEAGYVPAENSYACRYPEVSTLKDASAAAIVASALFELADLSANAEYRRVAVAMLESLSSPEYRAVPGENGNFVIRHCTGGLPQKTEIDVPLVYADYYYLEALVRYKKWLEGK